MKHKHSLPRWQLETHNDKRGVWQHEATWHDGENARGTPRLERAMKEGRDLMDAGETVRIVDLRTGYAHYPNEWDGMVPNAEAGVIARLRWTAGFGGNVNTSRGPASSTGAPPTGNCGQCQRSAGRARSETRRRGTEWTRFAEWKQMTPEIKNARTAEGWEK